MGTRLYVGRVHQDVRERDMERFFKGYGKIREIVLKNGYGFVEFSDSTDAEDAKYDLSGKDLMGERVIIEHARGRGGGGGGGYRGSGGGYDRRGRFGRGGGYGGGYGDRRPAWGNKYGPPTRTDNRLIVENLSTRVGWQDLKDYMRKAGEVTYADAHKQHQGEGIVEFASFSDMKNALEKLDNTEINGKRIRLIEQRSSTRSRRSRSRSRSHSSRSSSRDRSRSGSRSRSRSRSRSAESDKGNAAKSHYD